MNQTTRILSVVGLLVGAAGLLVWASEGTNSTRVERKAPTGQIRPQDMADSLRLVIAADRQVYARHAVQPLEDRHALRVGDRPAADTTVPSPCELLRRSTVEIQTQGAEFHYSLRALAPLDQRNAPETDVERIGLNFVTHHPDQNYYSQETLGGRRYFTAIYPDRATVPACVTCHNAHPASPKRDFKVGDVLGGLVVRVALEF